MVATFFNSARWLKIKAWMIARGGAEIGPSVILQTGNSRWELTFGAGDVYFLFRDC